MSTAPESELPHTPQGSEAAQPRVAFSPVPAQWVQQPQAGRRDRPLVEDLDAMWEDAFASW
jgi:hypothetical protein